MRKLLASALLYLVALTSVAVDVSPRTVLNKGRTSLSASDWVVDIFADNIIGGCSRLPQSRGVASSGTLKIVQISLKRHGVPLPLVRGCVICSLASAHHASLSVANDIGTLSIVGGDAASAYRTELVFDRRGIREILSFGESGELYQETKFHEIEVP